MKLLVIEDNPDIVANIYGYLEPLGFQLDCARSGVAGLAMAAEGTYDAVVLDLTLPGMDGIDVCRKLRVDYASTTPLLMLTARDGLQDKVIGFNAGADDYLVKPFSLQELELRLNALVRRSRGTLAPTVMRFADLRYDLGTREVTRSGIAIQLTPTGHKLLAALMRAAPRLLTRDALVHEVWGDEAPDSDALRTHIHALRVALDKPFGEPLLKTLPGIGYKLVDPHG
jgi:DNA-binding response OmpR family regulator